MALPTLSLDDDSDPFTQAMEEGLGMGKKPIDNLDLQRLHIIRRALTHLLDGGGTLAKPAYTLVRNTFYAKKLFKLEFPREFTLDFNASSIAPPAPSFDTSALPKEVQEKYALKRAKDELAAPAVRTLDDLFASRHQETLLELNLKLRDTREAITERIEAIEEELGTFECKVGKLCAQIAAKDPGDAENIVKHINKILGKHLETPISHIGIPIYKYPLATAIEAQYPDKEDKLGAFVAALEKSMGAAYPLKNFDPASLKSHPERIKKNSTEANIDLLSQSLRFNDTQKKLLSFLTCYDRPVIDELISAVMPSITSVEDYYYALSVLLDLKHEDIKAELKPDSTLVRFGFLAYDHEHYSYAIDKTLHHILRGNYQSETELLTGLLGPSPSTELKRADYKYMDGSFQRMQALLDQYVSGDSHKRTMALYGPRGTGKTEITAVLSQEMGVPAFLVGVAHRDDDAGAFPEEPSREERINDLTRKAFIIKQTGIKAFLVIDEADGFLDQEATHQHGSKAFINYILEKIGVPLVVIFNEPERLEAATKRRLLPAFEMSYMPLEARISAIIAKAKEHTGIELEESDARKLANLATSSSIAEIDSSIRTAAAFFNKMDKPQQARKGLTPLIQTEIVRAQTFINNGIPPLPADKRTGEFHTHLIASSAKDLPAMHENLSARYQRNAASFAGKAFAIIGASGTGKLSVARYLASITRKQPMIVNMDPEALQDPNSAYAKELQQSAREQAPIIFTGADEYLQTFSSKHELAKRIAAHTQPTFLVGTLSKDHPIDPARLHTMQLIKTDSLSAEQLQIACKKLLGVEVTGDELEECSNITIGNIMTIKDGLSMQGKLGDKETTLNSLKEAASVWQNRVQGSRGIAKKGSSLT